jgi:hypothetical protein
MEQEKTQQLSEDNIQLVDENRALTTELNYGKVRIICVLPNSICLISDPRGTGARREPYKQEP